MNAGGLDTTKRGRLGKKGLRSKTNRLHPCHGTGKRTRRSPGAGNPARCGVALSWNWRRPSFHAVAHFCRRPNRLLSLLRPVRISDHENPAGQHVITKLFLRVLWPPQLSHLAYLFHLGGGLSRRPALGRQCANPVWWSAAMVVLCHRASERLDGDRSDIRGVMARRYMVAGD